MAVTPTASAALHDLLCCMGLGFAAALLRDTAALLTGEGRLRTFFWDCMAFAAAAVLVQGFAAGSSSTGQFRWYMALGMALGALGWQQTFSPPMHALGKLPGRWLHRRLERLKRRISRQKRPKKPKKKAEKEKNGLQNRGTVIYN